MNPTVKRVYDALPVPIQNAVLTAFSMRLDRQRYGGRFAEFRALLEEAQWWDADRMRAWQDERLRAVVAHAYEHVPYYRELFDRHGIHPQRFRGQEDLPTIPVLTRETLKARLPDLLSRAYPKKALAEGHTSGTTGSPVTLFYSPDMMTMNYAALDRQYRWAGARLERHGDRVAVVRGNIIVPLTQTAPPFWRTNYYHRTLLLSNFHMTPANLRAYYEALRAFRPVVLDGYPSSVYVLAKVLLNSGERLPLKAVLTSSETLFDFQREAIERAFECRVFDYFGAAERVVFSVECEQHSGHHLCEEYGLCEIVDADHRPLPPGQEGTVVGTTLHNLGMPLIRYLTSDRTARKTQACACGRTLPLMEDVTTKAEDLLRLRDGRLISPSVLTHPFKPLDAIEASQLVQTDLDRLVIRIVKRPEYSDADSAHLVRELKARLGADMRIEFEFLDTLPRTKSGKFKWVISQVDLGL
jgi:phenylacetate-CoA ligase